MKPTTRRMTKHMISHTKPVVMVIHNGTLSTIVPERTQPPPPYPSARRGITLGSLLMLAILTAVFIVTLVALVNLIGVMR